MRINQFIARATGISRRRADSVIAEGRVLINGRQATYTSSASEVDSVTLDGKALSWQHTDTVLLNKPTGYVCSREGQGSRTIYDLLPKNLHGLKPVGRLDKDSSGLLVMTNDGQQANQLTHPRFQKEKTYEVTLNKALTTTHKQMLLGGVRLEDGVSQFNRMVRVSDFQFRVVLSEGRNRQIRRTFAVLGYKVIRLHRTQFGPFNLGKLLPGRFISAPFQ